MTGSPISEHGSDVEQLEEPEAWKYRKCDGVYELEGIFGGILEDWCQSFDVFQLTLAFLMDFLLLTFS